MRSQFPSSLTTPATPGAAAESTFAPAKRACDAIRHALLRAVRGMPMMLRLYFAVGMPAAPIWSISRQIESSSRCRSGSLPSSTLRALGLFDRPRCQRQLHHIERQPELLHMLALALQIIQTPVMRIAWRIDADMRDAELRPDPIVAVVTRPDLCPDIYRAPPVSPLPRAPVAPPPTAAPSDRRPHCAASAARSAPPPA